MKPLPSPLNAERRWYDITIPLQEGVAHWPGDTPFRFEQVATMAAGDTVDVGTVSMSVHSGTHMDAPSHFRQGAPTTSDIALPLLIGSAYVVSAIGHSTIGPEVFASLDLTHVPRVLLQTGAWTDYRQFPEMIPTLTAEAVAFLSAQGVVLLGLDLPPVDALDSKDLPLHHAIEQGGMIVLEGLDLRDVPPGRYQLIALPLRLMGADASPVRAILIAESPMPEPKVVDTVERLEGPLKVLRRECDLSDPITAYLKAQGYTVRSEVHGCDITALLGEELVVIELKRHFSTDLLVQAIERQRIADSVYVALPIEGEFGRSQRNSKRWKGIELLLKRLEVGLIVVAFPEERALTVEVVFHPLEDPKPRKKPKKRRTLLREIAGRSEDYNVGGSVGRELLTAYREQAIYIALLLERFGPLTPAGCRAHGASPKAQTILHRNVYGWFDRRGRGLYALRSQVIEHLGEKWPHVVAYHEEKINSAFLSAEC